MPTTVTLPDKEPDHAGVAFHPPFLLAGALLLGFLIRQIVPLGFLPSGVSGSIGPVVTAAAFGLVLWAIFTMRAGHASIPTGEPTDAIVKSGPYRFSRNPIYVAMLALQLGVGVWTDSLWFLALAGVSAILLWWGVISREERYLERKFGADYLVYRDRVRRWL
jgi:protein-S-isoprenylcysteine O-methyltransferase Ste14